MCCSAQCHEHVSRPHGPHEMSLLSTARPQFAQTSEGRCPKCAGSTICGLDGGGGGKTMMSVTFSFPLSFPFSLSCSSLHIAFSILDLCIGSCSSPHIAISILDLFLKLFSSFRASFSSSNIGAKGGL